MGQKPLVKLKLVKSPTEFYLFLKIHRWHYWFRQFQAEKNIFLNVCVLFRILEKDNRIILKRHAKICPSIENFFCDMTSFTGEEVLEYKCHVIPTNVVKVDNFNIFYGSSLTNCLTKLNISCVLYSKSLKGFHLALLKNMWRKLWCDKHFFGTVFLTWSRNWLDIFTGQKTVGQGCKSSTEFYFFSEDS